MSIIDCNFSCTIIRQIIFLFYHFPVRNQKLISSDSKPEYAKQKYDKVE